jgi:hypothetical protein
MLADCAAEGTVNIGRRYWASHALSRCNAADCAQQLSTLLEQEEPDVLQGAMTLVRTSLLSSGTFCLRPDDCKQLILVVLAEPCRGLLCPCGCRGAYEDGIADAAGKSAGSRCRNGYRSHPRAH